MTSSITVVEYTDPGCVWSWGSEPQLRWLRLHYGDQLSWRRVFGGQVDDLARTHPGRDARRDAEAFRQDWLGVAAHTGAPVPERLAWMHRSTLPASEAARAAERQGVVVAERVLRRLRETVFVAGRPADTPGRIEAALFGLDGLDLPRLLADLRDPEVAASVVRDFEETRRPHPAVIGRTGPGPNPGAAKADGDRLRYGFPTLVVNGAVELVVSGWQDTAALEAAVLEAGAARVDHAPPLDPDEAVDRFGSLTTADLRLLTGDRAPGGHGVVRFEGAVGGPVWFAPGNAAWLDDASIPAAARAAA